jgi:hypothetical protein
VRKRRLFLPAFGARAPLHHRSPSFHRQIAHANSFTLRPIAAGSQRPDTSARPHPATSNPVLLLLGYRSNNQPWLSTNHGAQGWGNRCALTTPAAANKRRSSALLCRGCTRPGQCRGLGQSRCANRLPPSCLERVVASLSLGLFSADRHAAAASAPCHASRLGAVSCLRCSSSSRRLRNSFTSQCRDVLRAPLVDCASILSHFWVRYGPQQPNIQRVPCYRSSLVLEAFVTAGLWRSLFTDGKCHIHQFWLEESKCNCDHQSLLRSTSTL